MKKIVKRFIAGANCPKCSSTDSIRRWSDDKNSYHECIVCGYVDTIITTDNIKIKEPVTRVNKQKEASSKTVPLKFFKKNKESPD